MPKGSLRFKLNRRLRQQMNEIQQLKRTNPELFRRCGSNMDQLCCQAYTAKKVRCSRPALTELTYVRSLGCCLLCWQHARMYGFSGLYKLVKLLATMGYDYDTYCHLFPEECDEILKNMDYLEDL